MAIKQDLRFLRRLSCQSVKIYLILSAISGCVSPHDSQQSTLTPILGVEDITRKIPARVKNREGWAKDILQAIEAIDKKPTEERVCAVIAVIEQESGYQADPSVANLPRIVRSGMLEKLSRLGILAEPALKVILAGKAPGTNRSFEQRVRKLRTESDLDRLFQDIAATYREKIPGTFAIASGISLLAGKGSLADLNPVTTAGSMQVKVSYAREVAANEGLSESQLRELLYTRPGGVRFGTSRLIDYPASYDDIIYRFADYNAGPYASRNAAFQSMLSDLTGQPLALDGDLLAYDKDGDPKDFETNSLKAILSFAKANDIWEWTVNRNVANEKSQDFEDTTIWEAVRKAWQAKTGKKPPYARMPEVKIESPKLSRKLSTSWFASNVKKRYFSCRSRG